MGKIHKFNNNCHLVAGMAVYGGDEDKLLAAWKRHGWVENTGMHSRDYHEALRELGVEVVKIDWTEVRHRTVGQIMKQFPTGVYLVGVDAHVFVMRDGQIMDPNVGGKLRRRVLCLHHVPNAAPYKRPGKNLRMVVHPGWRQSQGAARRRQALRWAREFLGQSGRWPTEAEWLKGTPIKLADINYDLERGKMEWVA